MALSILILGFALHYTWHYMVLAVFMAAQLVGIILATVGLNAYLLDAYPEGSGEVGAWIVVGRTLGGFMATYVEIEWVERSGPVKALGAQGEYLSQVSFLDLRVFPSRKPHLRVYAHSRFPNHV